jgi:hypothetical protein
MLSTFSHTCVPEGITLQSMFCDFILVLSLQLAFLELLIWGFTLEPSR